MAQVTASQYSSTIMGYFIALLFEINNELDKLRGADYLVDCAATLKSWGNALIPSFVV